MAMKDWKKTYESNSSISWRHKERDEVIGVTIIMNNPKGYPYSFAHEGKILKDFKSKQQALAYARNYMRTH